MVLLSRNCMMCTCLTRHNIVNLLCCLLRGSCGGMWLCRWSPGSEYHTWLYTTGTPPHVTQWHQEEVRVSSFTLSTLPNLIKTANISSTHKTFSVLSLINWVSELGTVWPILRISSSQKAWYNGSSEIWLDIVFLFHNSLMLGSQRVGLHTIHMKWMH